MKTQIILCLILTAASLCVLVPAIKTVHAASDWSPSPPTQRLWSTDFRGLAEVQEFNNGNPIYLMTSGVERAIEPGNYTLYLFEGNLIVGNVAPYEGKKLPADFGVPVVTIFNITTDADGKFGQPIQGGPILIWSSSKPGNYTIILDRFAYWDNDMHKFFGSPGYGEWNIQYDYRDDLCTDMPTPPSFHVIPQVPLGTLAATLSLFCGLGLFLRMKKRPTD